MKRIDEKKYDIIRDSRHLKRWDKDASRQDTPEKFNRDVQRACQDVKLSERHAGFDEQAKDNTMKYERPSFVVVGEGSKSSNEKYADGYERIDWSK